MQIDLSTDAGVETYAAQQLELYLNQLREHAQLPTVFHFLVQRDPADGSELPTPRPYVVSYDHNTMRTQERAVATQHLSKSLSACAVVCLSVDSENSRVLLSLRTREWSSQGYCSIENNNGEVHFGPLTQIEEK